MTPTDFQDVDADGVQASGGGGKGIQAFTYDAYGNMVATGFGAATQANAMTNLLYSGEYTNAATGLQYLRARFYSPATGRFNRLDPYAGNTSDPLSLHKYLYTDGNPVMGIDPSGRTSLSAVLGTMSIQQVMISSLLGAALIPATIRATHTVDVAQSLSYLLNSGIEGGAQVFATVMSKVQEYEQDISDALRSLAQKLGKDLEDLMKLRPFPVIESVTPKIYAFDMRLLRVRPDWYFLKYLGSGSQVAINRNRASVWEGYGYLMATAPVGYQLDEFPYASTLQGGRNGPAQGYSVPAKENLIQGGMLGAFYRWTLEGQSKPFIVVPVPI